MKDRSGRSFAMLIEKSIQWTNKEDKYRSVEICQEKEVGRCWKDTKNLERKADRCKIFIKENEWNNAV
jgi:hypothetical protein